MYSFVPNTKVEFRAALIGGITAGFIWALVGKAFTAFIVYSSSMVAVYTGFAIVLTTLIWVYLSWLILLIGAQLAFYVQFPQYLRHGQAAIELSGRDREQVGVSIMYLIATDFAVGKTYWTTNRLAIELDIPSIAIAPVLFCLEKAGLIVATEHEYFFPGRDLSSISLANIVEAVRTLATGRLSIAIRAITPAVMVMNEVERAIHEPLSGRSLRDLITAAARQSLVAGDGQLLQQD